jgi:two-component system nitrogen regulation response regulator NtrX
VTGERILVVDDERGVRTSLGQLLRFESYRVEDAPDAETALTTLEKNGSDLVLLDVKLPGMDGLDALKEIRRLSRVPVVMMSAHASIETAVEATKLGAHDFIEKPLSDEKILLTVRNTLDFHRMAEENVSLRQRFERRYELVGHGPVIERVRERIRRVGPTQGRVLITGENGTGKELVARAIHRESSRANAPFVKFNCAAIPLELAESELFGHERGSFTGATRMRKGRFEQADRGTLFLDEIGDLKPDLQAKLLRVLQEGEFERVGGSETIRVDVRIIAATNQDLDKARADGRFREDLYFRINVIPFHVPPLRERAADIPDLVEHFIGLSVEEDVTQGRKQLDPEALELLTGYPWPGNIRELKNVVDRILILVPGERVTAEDVRMCLPAAPPTKDGEGPAGHERSLRGLLADFERRAIVARLAEMGGNVTRTADELGLERSHLYKKMRQLGIARD